MVGQGQGRAGQGQGRVGQVRLGQGTVQGRVEQGSAEQGSAEQGRAGYAAISYVRCSTVQSLQKCKFKIYIFVKQLALSNRQVIKPRRSFFLHEIPWNRMIFRASRTIHTCVWKAQKDQETIEGHSRNEYKNSTNKTCIQSL